MTKKINVMFCLNENYASKLVVALISLLENNINILPILSIFIRTNDMKPSTVNIFRSIVESYHMKESQIHFIYTDRLCEMLEKEKIAKFKNNYICYFKSFGLDELKCDSERLLVIDCDVMINNSIEELYYYDLKGKAIGVVREYPSNNTQHFDRNGGEYNTGVLLYDLAKCKENHFEEKLKECISFVPPNEWRTGDQTLFTYCVEKYNLVELLPLKYNFIMNQTFFTYDEFVYIRNIDNDSYYSKDEYSEAKNNPTIIHLISGDFVISPWYFEGNKKIKLQWDKYYNRAEELIKLNFDVYSHITVRNRIRHILVIVVWNCIPRKLGLLLFKNIYKKV